MLEAGPQRADTPRGHSPAAAWLTLQVPLGEGRGGGGGCGSFSLTAQGTDQVLQPEDTADCPPAGEAVEAHLALLSQAVPPDTQV